MTRRSSRWRPGTHGLLVVCAGALAAACAASAPTPTPNTPSDAGAETGAGTGPGPGPAPSGTTPGASTASPGCGKEATAGFADAKTLTAAGKTRSFALAVPDGYDPKRAYSLVFAFHGDGGTGGALRRSMKLEAAANGAAIVAYPDGLGKTWDIDTAPEQNQEAALFDALVASIAADYCIDPQRVFATGFSRGGYLANQLGCWRGSALRGVASNGSGGPFGKKYDDTGHLVCPRRGMATIIFHGQNDSPSEAQKSLDHWAWANSCPDKTKQTDTAPAPCKSVSGCAADKPVTWCLIPGMGHQIWSESDAATWAFFAKL